MRSWNCGFGYIIPHSHEIKKNEHWAHSRNKTLHLFRLKFQTPPKATVEKNKNKKTPCKRKTNGIEGNVVAYLYCCVHTTDVVVSALDFPTVSLPTTTRPFSLTHFFCWLLFVSFIMYLQLQLTQNVYYICQSIALSRLLKIVLVSILNTANAMSLTMSGHVPDSPVSV